MTHDQALVAVLVEAALLATAAGLLARRRWGLSWFFSAYVPAVLTGNVLVTWRPDAFLVPGFWMAKQIVYDALKLGLALELAWRTFRVFPGAAAATRSIVLLVLLASTVAVMGVSGTGVDYLSVVGDVHPRVLNGTIWLLVAILAVAQWYRVPVHPFHRAILASFGAYLMVFGSLLGLVGVHGWAARRYFDALDPLAYLVVTSYWAYVAWRPETALAREHVETLRRLAARTA